MNNKNITPPQKERAGVPKTQETQRLDATLRSVASEAQPLPAGAGTLPVTTREMCFRNVKRRRRKRHESTYAGKAPGVAGALEAFMKHLFCPTAAARIRSPRR
ncbi:hypothetical protein QN219_23910 [Sinorhizobium sp. 7-81]|uniref:hypothetical protein n=1 Tax=Sinorhizobium sp. 8-89 TaxID=3049089 RepID=UPI0024C2113B|nr:hypothetical protein [Sinorhizobium sp. 8-89]MDK1493054.1 hypothetical protein [Sinorhizobium sp. 8-89]